DVFHHNTALMERVGWVAGMQVDAEVMVAKADMIKSARVAVIIDTWGQTDAREGPDGKAFRVLLDLIGNHNIYVKIHCTNRLPAKGVPLQNLITNAQALIARAPDHILWGTDWPHSEIFEPGKMPNDGDLLDYLLLYAPDAATRKKVLVDNPKRLFGG